MNQALLGYTPAMSKPLDESLHRDTMCGIELQLIELVEQQRAAEVQGRTADAAELQPRIDSLHRQLAYMAEVVAAADGVDVHGP
jgi:hypothetical protein